MMTTPIRRALIVKPFAPDQLRALIDAAIS